jgi:hypothetical protein
MLCDGEIPLFDDLKGDSPKLDDVSPTGNAQALSTSDVIADALKAEFARESFVEYRILCRRNDSFAFSSAEGCCARGRQQPFCCIRPFSVQTVDLKVVTAEESA